MSASNTQLETVNVHLAGGAATVELNRPEVLNAWNAQLGLDLLASRLAENEIRELIIATNPTVEGEATAHLLAQIARQAKVRATRLAQIHRGSARYGGS